MRRLTGVSLPVTRAWDFVRKMLTPLFSGSANKRARGAWPVSRGRPVTLCGESPCAVHRRQPTWLEHLLCLSLRARCAASQASVVRMELRSLSPSLPPWADVMTRCVFIRGAHCQRHPVPRVHLSPLPGLPSFLFCVLSPYHSRLLSPLPLEGAEGTQSKTEVLDWLPESPPLTARHLLTLLTCSENRFPDALSPSLGDTYQPPLPGPLSGGGERGSGRVLVKGVEEEEGRRKRLE